MDSHSYEVLYKLLKIRPKTITLVVGLGEFVANKLLLYYPTLFVLMRDTSLITLISITGV